MNTVSETTSDTIDSRLLEMLDHYEITRTLKQYCFACDRGDEARMAAVYLDDSWDEHGVYAARGPAFARIMSQAVAEQTDSMFHLLGQSQIRVDGDVVGADSYFLAVSRNTGADGVVMCNQLGGRFVDYLERVDGGWKIKKRIVVRDWSISIDRKSTRMNSSH